MAAVKFDEEKLNEARRAMVSLANGDFKAELNKLAASLGDYANDNGLMQKAFELCGVFEKNFNNSLVPYINDMAKAIEEYCGVAIDLQAAATNDKLGNINSVNTQADVKKVDRSRF